MSISGNCLPEPGKCPGKPLIALPDRPCGQICRLLISQLNQRVTSPVSMRRQLWWFEVAWIFVILRVAPQYSRKPGLVVEMETISAQLPKSSYSNSCKLLVASRTSYKLHSMSELPSHNTRSNNYHKTMTVLNAPKGRFKLPSIYVWIA